MRAMHRAAMVLEINSVDIHPGREAAFEQAFAQCIPLLLRVEGCRTATLLRCVEHPGRYIVQVEWNRLSDHVDGYPATAEAAEIRSLLRPLIARAEPMHFEAAGDRGITPRPTSPA